MYNKIMSNKTYMIYDQFKVVKMQYELDVN